MDPTQPQTNPQPNISVDYLNQIAPQAPKRKIPLTNMQLIIVGVILVVIVVVLVIVLGSDSGKKPLQQLAARLQTTETIVDDASLKLKSTELRALNSDLKIYLTNTNRDIVAPLLKDKIEISKLDKNIVTSEAGKDVTNRLEEARLNAVYDRTYAREIAYRLETILTLMRQVDKSTSNKDLKAFLVNAFSNLEPTQKSFADFNATNS